MTSDVQFVLERYFGEVDADVEGQFAAMRCSWLLREAMWSMVSEIHSKIEFDYAAHTAGYLGRFWRALEDRRGSTP